MEGKNRKGKPIPTDIAEKLKILFMKKDRLVILLLGGILLLVIALPVSNQEESEKLLPSSEDSSSEAAGETDREDYASYLEQKLADALSQVQGVGRTEVMVTLRSSGEKVIGKDISSESESVQETDSQGGSRSTASSSSSQATVYRGDGSGGQAGEPYVTEELAPVVEGVIVIAEGGDDAVTVQNITEAVQALFEIDTHKIKVMKSN